MITSVLAVHFKNLYYSDEVLPFQVSLSEKTSLLETAEEKIAELTTKVNEQQKLIQKLEDDILKVLNNCLCHHFYISPTLIRI